jgi:hypothetical protein
VVSHSIGRTSPQNTRTEAVEGAESTALAAPSTET